MTDPTQRQTIAHAAALALARDCQLAPFRIEEATTIISEAIAQAVGPERPARDYAEALVEEMEA